MNTKPYRPGAVGALLDLYEGAIQSLDRYVQQLPEGDFSRVIDSTTDDEDCRSIETIMRHVVGSGYQYVVYIQEAFKVASQPPDLPAITHATAGRQLNDMMAYTLTAVEPMCLYPYERFEGIDIHTRWGQDYDFEQLMEHAILHVMRHHRQIERLRAAG